MQRRGMFGVALTGAVVVALVVLARDLARSADLRYISRATGMVFPSGCADVDVYDSGEFYLAAHLRLPVGEVDPFLEKGGFQDTVVSVAPWIDVLKPWNREIPEDAELVFLEGREDLNAWVCALDRNSGRLWMVVFYPDPGGTPP